MTLTRTRRRILIATLVVVGLIGVVVWMRTAGRVDQQLSGPEQVVGGRKGTQVASSSSSSSRLDQRLVGSWEYVLPPNVIEEEHLVTTFRADGTFEVECTDFPREAFTVGEWSGKWWVRDDHLVQHYPMAQTSPAMPFGLLDQEAEIVEVTPTEFRIRQEDDSIIVYRRVAE